MHRVERISLAPVGLMGPHGLDLSSSSGAFTLLCLLVLRVDVRTVYMKGSNRYNVFVFT